MIERRFAVGDNARIDAKGDPRPLTLEQVGKILGVTKERVRQIQNRGARQDPRALRGRLPPLNFFR